MALYSTTANTDAARLAANTNWFTENIQQAASEAGLQPLRDDQIREIMTSVLGSNRMASGLAQTVTNVWTASGLPDWAGTQRDISSDPRFDTTRSTAGSSGTAWRDASILRAGELGLLEGYYQPPEGQGGIHSVFYVPEDRASTARTLIAEQMPRYRVTQQAEARAADPEGTAAAASATQFETYQRAVEWSTERAQAMTPEYLRSMMTYATRAAGQIDTRTQQMYASLGIEPTEILGGMEMAMSLAREYMGGNVPQDVQDQMQRALAERNISAGLQGPIADLSYARNLGLTTMQLQNYGMQQYPQLAGQQMALGQMFNPGTANLTSLYSGLVGSIAPYWLGAGQQIGNTLAQSTGANITAANQLQFDYWRTIQNMQYQASVDAANQRMWQQSVDASRNNNYLRAGATVVGAIAGGPWGAALATGLRSLYSWFRSRNNEQESLPTGQSYGSGYSPAWGYSGVNFSPTLTGYMGDARYTPSAGSTYLNY